MAPSDDTPPAPLMDEKLNLEEERCYLGLKTRRMVSNPAETTFEET